MRGDGLGARVGARILETLMLRLYRRDLPFDDVSTRPFSVSDLFAERAGAGPELGQSGPWTYRIRSRSNNNSSTSARRWKKVIIWGQGGEIINPPVDHGRRCTL